MRTEIFQQRRGLKQVNNHDLFGSIVVEVSNGSSPRGMPGGNTGARSVRHIEKLPISTIPIELARLAKLFTHAILIDKRIDVSGGDK